MVDITRCAQCGKTIPALDNGCAWCDAEERGRPGFREDNWMPLSIRMLLWLFVANLAMTGIFASLTLVANAQASAPDSAVAIAALLRLLLAGAVLVGIWFREPWGRWLPLSFLAFEGLAFLALQIGLFPPGRWIGGWLAPLWNLLFVFLFLRDDVRSRLDPHVADRREVGELIESFRNDDPAD